MSRVSCLEGGGDFEFLILLLPRRLPVYITSVNGQQVKGYRARQRKEAAALRMSPVRLVRRGALPASLGELTDDVPPHAARLAPKGSLLGGLAVTRGGSLRACARGTLCPWSGDFPLGERIRNWSLVCSLGNRPSERAACCAGTRPIYGSKTVITLCLW